MYNCECCGIHIATGRFCEPCGEANRNGDDSCIGHPDAWHCELGNCDGSDCTCEPYELVSGVELSIGDRVEYVGTTHDYSVATVIGVQSVDNHGTKLVTFSCPLSGHGTHDHWYSPNHGYVRRMF